MLFTLKKLLLQFIPYKAVRGFRKKCNLDYIFFGASKKNIGNYLIQVTNHTPNWYGMEDQLGTQVLSGFKDCYETYRKREGFLRKYILEVRDCIIEPQFGWALLRSDDTLVFDSVSNNAWLEAYHPNSTRYKQNKINATVLDEAVVINMIKGGEDNYWHFLHDLLGQVSMAIKTVGNSVPYIISKNLFNKPYFKGALERSETLRSIQWITRDDQYFRLGKGWFFQPMPNAAEQFFDVSALLDVPAAAAGGHKIFLTRSSRRIRFLKNRNVIETIAKKYGYQVVDTDMLSLDEQVELFSKTKVLVGIHGAGLTNMIFRKGIPLTLFELLPGDYIQPHYFWLCKCLGHNYDCMVGTSSALDTSFEIDPQQFEQKLQGLPG